MDGWIAGLACLGQSDVEIQMKRVYAVSRAAVFLPFSVEDAARSEAEVEASQVWYGMVWYSDAQYEYSTQMPNTAIATCKGAATRM